MLEIGFEAFTFRKLADKAGITEATVYKYFSNKHRLLQYYFDLYWVWMKELGNLEVSKHQDPEQKVQCLLDILCGIWPEKSISPSVEAVELRALLISEGLKSLLNKNVDDDNRLKLFAPYKEYCLFLSEELNSIRPNYHYPRSLATVVIEMSHSMEFYMEHLPSLTELSMARERQQLSLFFYQLILSAGTRN
jgi:AcrR family transcriptional regulator